VNLDATDELIARVDERIQGFERAKAQEQAEQAAARAQDEAEQAKRAERSKRSHERTTALLAKLDKARAEQSKTFKKPTFSYGPTGVDIQCGNPDCRYQGDAGEFWTTRFGLPMKHGDIQCPKCNWAVRRKWVNHEIKLIPIQPYL
jgi:hypothetical protein